MLASEAQETRGKKRTNAGNAAAEQAEAARPAAKQRVGPFSRSGVLMLVIHLVCRAVDRVDCVRGDGRACRLVRRRNGRARPVQVAVGGVGKLV